MGRCFPRDQHTFYPLEMGLQRIKRGSSDPFGAIDLYFKIGEKVEERFNQKYEREGWDWNRDVDKALNYQTRLLTISRIKDGKDGQRSYQAHVPMGENQFLKIGFGMARDQASFFALFLEITEHGPEQIPSKIQEKVNLNLVGTGERLRLSLEFQELCDRLAELKILRHRSSVNVKREVEHWSQYLAALEKIIIDKTILLKVIKGEKKKSRGRWEIEYELDIEEYARNLHKVIREEAAPYQTTAVQIKDGKGYLELKGVIDCSDDYLNRLENSLVYNFFAWQKGRHRQGCILPFQFQWQLKTKESQTHVLEALHFALREHTKVVSRKETLFSFAGWKGEEYLKVLLGSPNSPFMTVETPKIHVQLHHREASLEIQMELCQAAMKALEERREISRMGIVAAGEVWLQAPESEQPDSWKALESFMEVSKTPEVQEPKDQEGEEEKMARWNFKLKFIEEPKKVWQKVHSRLRKLGEGRFEMDRGQLKFISEPAFLNWTKEVEEAIPEVKVELTQIFQEVGFRTAVKSFREQCIQTLKSRLRDAFSKEQMEIQPKENKGGLEGEVFVKSEEQGNDVLLMLQTMGETFLKVKEEAEPMRTRLNFVWDEEDFENFLNAKRSDLRNSEVKFLTEADKVDYDKEVAGKDGNFRGGNKLGKLVGLRKMKVRVELAEGDDAVPRSGYLLPVFRGDLAQHGRLKEAIKTVQYRKTDRLFNPRLADFIFDPTMALPNNLVTDVSSDQYWQLKHELNEAGLNAKQKEAVWKAIEAQDLMLIQGPPGTGKTTVISEIIWQMLQANPDAKILISSQAHLAVDNVLQRLYQKSLIRPLRIASSQHASKAVEPEGQKYVRETIEGWAKASPNSKEEKEHEANAIRMWLDRIPDAVQAQSEMEVTQAKWLKKLKKATPDVKAFFKDIYLENVNVVAATCMECGRWDFKELFSDGFDCVIIDEASKATPPELLVPLIMGRKSIIIGDHKQLPPMIEERQVEEVLKDMGYDELAADLETLKTSQFEKLFEGADPSITTSLRTQYRMHKDIMEVINPFYQEEGGLLCGIERTMDLEDLDDKGSRWHGIEVPTWMDTDTHVLWIDTQTPETNHQPSYSNDGEVDVIRALLQAWKGNDRFQAYMDHLTEEEDREIGMISFYGQQVKKLKKVVEEFGQQIPIRLRTVDKFQGMERNIIIVSTVRSNTQVTQGQPASKPPRPNHNIGFAKDFRRINVAFSRARRLLIVVGNEDHFAEKSDLYKHIKTIIGRQGGRIDASQIKPHQHAARRDI